MKMPLISIVLPVHNGARYLDESVQSCLAQTFSDWELIIVDDASTDDTPKLIAGYERADRRIRTIRHERNRLLPGALNSGFRLAQGQFLTWTSDDNAYRPHALERMLAYLQANPEVAMVYADYEVMDEDGCPVERRYVGTPEVNSYHNWVGACFLYRRYVYEIIGDYSEGLFLVEDYDYWLRVQARFRMLPLHEDLYRYRDHAASLTRQRAHTIMLQRVKAVEKNLSGMPWMDPLRLAGFYRGCADAALACRDYPAVRELVRKAVGGGHGENVRGELAWLVSRTYPLKTAPFERLWYLLLSFLMDPRRLRGALKSRLRRRCVPDSIREIP